MIDLTLPPLVENELAPIGVDLVGAKKVFEIPLSSPNTQVWVQIHADEPAWLIHLRFNRIAQRWMIGVSTSQQDRLLTVPIFPQQHLFGPLGRAYLQVDWDWTCFFPLTQTESPQVGRESILMLVME